MCRASVACRRPVRNLEIALHLSRPGFHMRRRVALSSTYPSSSVSPIFCLPLCLPLVPLASSPLVTCSPTVSSPFTPCFLVSHIPQSIGLISISSFSAAAILLTGLFCYDIFWVFGTEVMVSAFTPLLCREQSGLGELWFLQSRSSFWCWIEVAKKPPFAIPCDPSSPCSVLPSPLLPLCFLSFSTLLSPLPQKMTVATRIEAPVKFLFPALTDPSKQYPFSVLGLGDVVIPATFCTLMRWARSPQGSY